MKKEDWEKICKKWQKFLLLDNWRLTFKYRDNSEATETKVEANTFQITIIASNNIIKNSIERLNLIACHELLHARLAPLDDLMNSIFTTLPNKSSSIYADWFHAEIEKITEQLTIAFISKK